MIGRSIGLVALYVAGLVGLGWWSLAGLLGDAPKEDWALLIILPLAWLFSYWPTVGSLVVALRWRGLMRSLGEIQQRLENGQTAQPEARADIVETLVELAAKENGVPRFVVRRFVERAVDHAMATADSKVRA